jgi:hypothetical protein
MYRTVTRSRGEKETGVRITSTLSDDISISESNRKPELSGGQVVRHTRESQNTKLVATCAELPRSSMLSKQAPTAPPNRQEPAAPPHAQQPPSQPSSPNQTTPQVSNFSTENQLTPGILVPNKDPNTDIEKIYTDKCLKRIYDDIQPEDSSTAYPQPEDRGKDIRVRLPPGQRSRVVTLEAQPAWQNEVKTNSEMESQTSPADFRAAQVKVPDEQDFAAVHGDLQGHHGLDYTFRKLFVKCGSKWANERGMATKVKTNLKVWLQGCPACQKVKDLREKVKCKHSFIVSRPFLEVSYDIIVFTREDKHGNRYIIVSIDNFTKLVELKATKHKDAESVAQFLLELGSRYGKIARLRSDRDPAFTGLVVTYLNKIRGIESLLCVAYHPQANSICERQNAIIMQQLIAMCVSCELGPETKAAWSDLIPFIFSVVNNTPKNPLGISPLAMIYGIFANFERPLLPPSNSIGEESNPVDFVEELTRFQTQLLEAAEKIQEEHLAKYAAKYYKQRNEKHAEQPRTFQQGDFVLIKKTATGVASKLAPRYLGPKLVLERQDNDSTHPVLELMDLTDMKVSQAAAEDCKIFNTGWFEEASMIQELTKLAASDKEEFIVESICGHLPKGSKRNKPLNTYMFLVKWKDFQAEENTWEPWSGLKDLEPYVRYSEANPLLNLIPKK